MTDLVEQLWSEASEAVHGHREVVDARVGNLVMVAMCEAGLSASDESLSRTAAAWADTGPCTILGGARANPASAVAANAFLLHAGLADDAYRVAHHPGLTVIPAALAAVEAFGDREHPLSEAVAIGYEFSCRLADLFLPDVSYRGWRVTATVAPIASAATAGYIRDGMPGAVNAARLGCSLVGGPLGAVNGGDDWQVQPAIAAAAGMMAALVSREHRSNVGALEGDLGPLSHFSGRVPDASPRTGLRLDDVTFKQQGGAMYGQAIYQAVQQAEIGAGVHRLIVQVPIFAERYANQQNQETRSVASVEGTLLAALTTKLGADAAASVDQIEVESDPQLEDLSARLVIHDSDGTHHVITASGDTSSWTSRDVLDHVLRRTDQSLEASATEVQQIAFQEADTALKTCLIFANRVAQTCRGPQEVQPD